MVTTNSLNTYEVPTTNRERTMPSQPAFRANHTNAESNVTGNGTDHTIIYNNVVTDQNGDYNNATGVFTAPVTGFYLFTASIRMSGILGAHTKTKLVFSLNSGTNSFAGFDGSASAMDTAGGILHLSVGAGAYLTAADTVEVVITVFNSTKVVDLDSTVISGFSGVLLV